MAAKKAPMRKMAKPVAKTAGRKAPVKKAVAAKKPAAKRSTVGSANAAEKRVMDKKNYLSIARRTDAAGRSGMGETVTSNVYPKGKGRGNSSASLTAAAAARKAIKEGKDAWPAYNKSEKAAQKAAGWRMDPDRPGIYVSPKPKKPSAADFRKREERAKVIAAARKRRLGK